MLIFSLFANFVNFLVVSFKIFNAELFLIQSAVFRWNAKYFLLFTQAHEFLDIDKGRACRLNIVKNFDHNFHIGKDMINPKIALEG